MLEYDGEAICVGVTRDRPMQTIQSQQLEALISPLTNMIDTQIYTYILAHSQSVAFGICRRELLLTLGSQG